MSKDHKYVLARTLSRVQIIFYSFLASCSLVLVSLGIQWLIYNDWLHHSGPVRVVGTVLAFVTAFLLAFQWQEGIRQKGLETQRRLEIIAEMNDRIRNALQAIEFVAYAKDKSATEEVRRAVDVIDAALEDALRKSRKVATLEQTKRIGTVA